MATSINIFELDSARYGIPLADTREVFRIPTISPLPKAPGVIEGIVNIRGAIVPVFNLRRRFGLAEKPPHPAEHLLLAHAGTRAVAMRVDRVIGGLEIEAADIESSHGLTSGKTPFTGVAKLSDGLVLIHDLAAFLEESEADELDTALRAVPRP
jgi:purine-binding chemotaxis protein CheW